MTGVLILLLAITPHVLAVATTPISTQSPTEAQDLKRIEKIKDLVASRVAELKLVDKVGILGSVTDTNTTSVTINDDSNTSTDIDIDELTKFSDSADSKFGVSDIKKNDTVAAIGLYNKDTKRLLARTITKMHSLPVFFEGIITEKDTKNYTVTAIDASGKSRILNIDTSTKMQTFASGDDGTSKGGFSKITIGQRVFAAGFNDLKDATILNVSRLIYFADLAASVEMKNHAGPIATPSGIK